LDAGCSPIDDHLPLIAAEGGAKTPEAVGGQEPHVVSQFAQAAGRAELGPSQRGRQRLAAEIGPARGAEEQRAPTTDHGWRAVVEGEVGDVMKRVTGRGDDLEPEPTADDHLVSIGDGEAGEGHVLVGGDQVGDVEQVGQSSAA
jgi:hypothetical protein